MELNAQYLLSLQPAILVAVFNQLSGINAVWYFAPRIFEMAGLGQKAALLQSAGIGIINVFFTFLGLWLIDRIGRRTLLYIGSFGYIFSLGLIAWGFFTEHFAMVPMCLFAFMAAHAVGQGTVIWVLISEIFPNRHRAEGQALGSRLCIPVLLLHDGTATHLGEGHGARNQRRLSRRHAEETSYWGTNARNAFIS